MKRRYEDFFKRKPKGFTLAELLIALVILGVIATFTIPKVLSSQSDARYKSIAKEAAGFVSAAYQTYKINNTVNGATGMASLTPYFNYVAVDTTTWVDSNPLLSQQQCGAGTACLKLHNGAMLWWSTSGWSTFGNTASTNMMYFDVDPDGAASSVQAVQFALYTNGKLTTRGTVSANSYCGGGGPENPDPPEDPSWFSWN